MTRHRALYFIQLPFAAGAARGVRLSALGALLAVLLGGCGSSLSEPNPSSEPIAVGGAQSPTGSAGAGAGGAVEGSGAGAPGGAGPSNGASDGSGAAAAGSSGAPSS